MTSPTSPPESSRLKFHSKLLLGGVLVLGMVVFLVLIFSSRGPYQIFRLNAERQRLEQENARLTAENERLARTIDRLQHDPEMIQDLIRRELNFVKKNEIIFQLPPNLGPKPETPLPPMKSEPASLEGVKTEVAE
ncbi:MAG: septum formation initiator family protein [Deltaproteobacteria bacterium]|nr:septum formation initiator family protein [Deltaproteobacteria bacterium]